MGAGGLSLSKNGYAFFLPLLRKAAGEAVGDALLPGRVNVTVDFGGHLDAGWANKNPLMPILHAVLCFAL